jgi:hypothetical protein
MKLIKSKRLLPLSLLVAPVAGEMVINFEGLKTPWPVVLFSFLIFVFSAITLETEKHSLSRLKRFTFFLNIVRPIIALVGSINSLIRHGLRGFEYSETASWSIVILPFFLEAIKRGLDRLEWWNIVQNELPIGILEDGTEEAKKNNEYQLLKKVWALRYFCWSIILISCLWQFFALFIYGNMNNFPKNSEFITNCTKKPWGGESISYINCEKNTCYFSGSGWMFADVANRLGGASMAWTSLGGNVMINFFKNLRGDKEETKWSKRILIFLSYLFFFGLLFSFLGQKDGLNFDKNKVGVNGLEFCNLNFSYTTSSFNSKTGYIQEWFLQEWTALKQIALV